MSKAAGIAPPKQQGHWDVSASFRAYRSELILISARRMIDKFASCIVVCLAWGQCSIRRLTILANIKDEDGCCELANERLAGLSLHITSLQTYPNIVHHFALRVAFSRTDCQAKHAPGRRAHQCGWSGLAAIPRLTCVEILSITPRARIVSSQSLTIRYLRPWSLGRASALCRPFPLLPSEPSHQSSAAAAARGLYGESILRIVL
jgi:hypothetical protein